MAGDSNDAAYRKEQLDFISNTHGTTARETLLLLLPSVCSLLLMATISTLVGKYINGVTRFVLEFMILIVPTVLCCTIHSEAKTLVCIALLALSCTNLLPIALNNKLATTGRVESVVSNRRPFITNFRALTNVLTAICILAVDFKAFPRRYAKTESYGFSLMDTGVGFFVVANALVSREARDTVQHQKSTFLRTVLRNSLDCLRSCIPLLVLGSARYFSVEYFNYQRQVTEYGVHWNFFITLAAVKIFTSILTSVINPKYSLLAGILILTCYEYQLNTTGMKQWLFRKSRKGFISANREGIVSTVGYTGLYFVGVAIGRLIHSTYRRLDSKAKTNKPQQAYNFRLFNFEMQYSESMILCIKLSLISAQACAATLLLDGYFRVSRKFANAGYCAWMITLSTVMLTLLLLLDIIADILNKFTTRDTSSNRGKKQNNRRRVDQLSSTPEILEAVNYNGLAYFLVSNVLTGAVNMMMRTLYVEDIEAVEIITAYMAVGTALFTVLYRYKIQIRL